MSNEFTSKVTVIDSIMGSGKTSFLIDYMNSHTDELFCYITPYRDEIKRVREICSVRYFATPENYDRILKKHVSKREDIISLLDEGLNIASTHALFKTFDNEMVEVLKKHKYTLILDEVMDVVEEINISKDDIQLLINDNVIEIEENNRIKWINEDYNGEFSKYKTQIKNGEVFLYNNAAILWCFPTEVFKHFNKIIISTYLFRGQIQAYYYQMNNIEYEYKSVRFKGIEGFGNLAERKYELCDYIENNDLSHLKDLIHLYDGKLNDIGTKTKRMKNTPLTKTWYDNATNEQLKKVKDNTRSYFMNVCKKKSSEVLWTTFKDRFDDDSKKTKVIPRSYKNGYISSNLRATNEYRNRNTVAYLINKYSNPIIMNFLRSNGAEIDQDVYAVSELIQFVWRSSIRDDKEINLYIPSERMRKLFIEWLNNNLGKGSA